MPHCLHYACRVTSRAVISLESMRPRSLALLIALAAGTGIGLLYGWAIDPIQYVDVTPAILRADYRADYVLMVAEASAAQPDPELSARRLAILGDEPPADIVRGAIEYAQQQAFTADELTLLQDLFASMQAYRPGVGD